MVSLDHHTVLKSMFQTLSHGPIVQSHARDHACHAFVGCVKRVAVPHVSTIPVPFHSPLPRVPGRHSAPRCPSACATRLAPTSPPSRPPASTSPAPSPSSPCGGPPTPWGALPACLPVPLSPALLYPCYHMQHRVVLLGLCSVFGVCYVSRVHPFNNVLLLLVIYCTLLVAKVWFSHQNTKAPQMSAPMRVKYESGGFMFGQV